ncbi:chemotaxis protein CheW [Aliarcobacter butzleri]|uniref:Chemotaxis protein CheW n=1 Tax=Aliarcobacter butzleri TaxID=28197 RepID=A0AAP4PZE7_9BACT|nr:chemotaxis protein CheW [Aliarcobacter butzleri]MCG3676035.1 chemotaxis protein CheW [Aliarcobacter butzleri]MCG3704044.1 chemotaxis protein CheW [Aliarcobacter butzleri]MCG3713627.1 chemotaxis protein CheW [Aliarcobacter butzleri]MDN5052485.1 chemotaxis protein CheW [Aliarcobacter butzleri]MDN5075994.1 chemotaxis protein CheW [Aliarcobacter butzleri]
MLNETISYKGITIKRELYPIIKYIEDVDKYKDELGTLSSSWDMLALLGQLGDINIDIGKTKENFLNLTSTLLNHLSFQQIKKVTQEMRFKSQVTIDVLIRNLFERTADIGFLATDDDIRLFLENFVSKYDENSLVIKQEIQKRFKEYVSKYSVYFDIVLFDVHGKIVVRLNEDINLEKVDTSFIQKVLNTSDDYIESYKYHDFLPQYKKSLVYSYKVTKSNDSGSKDLGVLALCFRFTDEMNAIFGNLVDAKNKECLTILDEDGYVIASSDKEHINLGVKLPIVLNENYKIVSYAGRDYIAKTCETNGYQGFYGLKWYGHIMIPLEYAFLSDELNSLVVDENIINSMMENEQHFSKELKEVFYNSKTIQDNLIRVIWNGNIVQSKLNSTNREFSRALLNEIGITGNKANSSLDNLNQTIISSILKDCEFLSSLAIDIMDRNLYERANDCRWWALNSYFKEALDDYSTISEKKEEISSILKYINDLYTVYSNLIIFDKNGKIIAVSNEKEQYLIGKILTQDWIEKTLTLKDTSKYCVSKFEKTNLYENESTYIYCSAIRSFKDDNDVVGGIAIVFDSSAQFYTMLDEILPKDIYGNKQKGVYAFFTDKNKQIIATTSTNFEVNSYLDIDDSFFKLKNGQNLSRIIEFRGNYYAVGVKCSSGYREYKSAVDDYKNDVLSFVFILIGKTNSNVILSHSKTKFLTSQKREFTGETIELATFYLGKRLLAVNSKNVIESIGIEELQESIEMDKKNHFKGMVLHKNKLISVLDIRDFVNEEIEDGTLKNIILVEYDKDNVEHCVGLLVSSLETICTVEEKSIQHIQNHFLGTGTLIESLVDIKDSEDSKIAMLLNIKKLDDNFTKRV